LELFDQPAHVLLNLLKQHEVSAEDIMKSVLHRINLVEGDLPTTSRQATHDQKVRAYISIRDRDSLLSEARGIDKTLSSLRPGDRFPRLAGMPIAIKDIFCVNGGRTTAASRILESFEAPYDATAVDLLKKEAAIVLGKTNLDEFTFGSSTESSAFQPSTANPWDTSRVPGGSSGGSAAAIAAGETILSLGSDTAGSIRQPASFCGVVGLKPTYGRVSRYGLIAFASSLDCVGPITKDVHDAALMMEIIAGSDSRDGTSANIPTPEYTKALRKDVKGLRIGLPRQYFTIDCPDESGAIVPKEIDRDVHDRVRDAIAVFRDCGAIIHEDINFPFTRFAIPCYFVNSRIEAMSNLNRYDGVKYGFRSSHARDLYEMYKSTRGEGFGDQIVQRILMGLLVTSEYFDLNFQKAAMLLRGQIRQDFVNAFKEVDVILSPTSPFTAFPLKRAGGKSIFGDTVLMQYADCLTVPANHAGLPAISVPCGFDRQGLPIGLQLIGREWEEETILRAAYAYEQQNEWHLKRPPITNHQTPLMNGD
jgi:aspartyl-tRNA(Asn)/glutamyl-tRNA(Gln) amidotransferase subunit A